MPEKATLIKRKIGIDILKGICAVLVVLVHFPFLGMGGKILTVIARVAVPVFFMCSGYFLKKTEESNKSFIIGKIIHIGKITIVACILYIGYTIYCEGIGYVISEINIVNLAKVLVFNAPQISSFHLWFLFALIYTYALYYLMCKLRLQKVKLLIAIMCFLVNLIVREALFMVGIDILAQFVRNAYFFGLPLFIVGTWIRDSKEHLQKIKIRKWCILSILGLVLSILENHFLCEYTLELSFGTILYAVGVFIIALKYQGGDVLKFAYLGEKCSLYIYVIHIIVGTLVFKCIATQVSCYWIATLLTLLISVAISVVIAFIKDKMVSNSNIINIREVS